MLITALISILCAIWACVVTTAMAMTLIANAIFCFVMAVKWRKNDNTKVNNGDAER